MNIYSEYTADFLLRNLADFEGLFRGDGVPGVQYGSLRHSLATLATLHQNNQTLQSYSAINKSLTKILEKRY